MPTGGSLASGGAITGWWGRLTPGQLVLGEAITSGAGTGAGAGADSFAAGLVCLAGMSSGLSEAPARFC